MLPYFSLIPAQISSENVKEYYMKLGEFEMDDYLLGSTVLGFWV